MEVEMSLDNLHFVQIRHHRYVRNNINKWPLRLLISFLLSENAETLSRSLTTILNKSIYIYSVFSDLEAETEKWSFSRASIPGPLQGE